MKPEGTDIAYRGNYYKIGLRNKIFFWCLSEWQLSTLTRKEFDHIKESQEEEANETVKSLYKGTRRKLPNVKKNTTGVKL